MYWVIVLATGGFLGSIITLGVQYAWRERKILQKLEREARQKAFLPSLYYSIRAMGLRTILVFDPSAGLKDKGCESVQIINMRQDTRERKFREAWVRRRSNKLELVIDGSAKTFDPTPEGEHELRKVLAEKVLIEVYEQEKKDQERDLQSPQPVPQNQ